MDTSPGPVFSDSTIETGMFSLITNQKKKNCKENPKMAERSSTLEPHKCREIQIKSDVFPEFSWLRNVLCCPLQVIFLIITSLNEFILFSHLKSGEPPGLRK